LAGRVLVIGGSRLHAGFYYAGPGRPYRWGSAGFYVSTPETRVEAESCPVEGVVARASKGLEEIASLVEEGLSKAGFSGVCLEVHSAPPLHMGLGATTQALLASACASRIALGLGGCGPDTVAALARRLGRARVSGAGTLAFAYGGFVVDAGNPDPGGPRPLLRLALPGDWVFVVVLPRLGRGLSGPAEEALLEGVRPPKPREETLMARGLLRMAAGIARGDLHEALEGLRDLQLGTGMYFSGAQGGAFRRDLLDLVAEASKYGFILAQSSWGPTLYTITTRQDAWGDAALLRSILSEVGVEGDVFVAEPLNMGARILVD
jgi:beta-ribofuranosylaminobenzene 5'-phosphate synthase